MKPPKFYDVPAGTPASRCKGPACTATIYFITSPSSGRPLPIHCDVEGGRRPSMTNDAAQIDAFAGGAQVYPGKGISHFADCVDVQNFSKRAP